MQVSIPAQHQRWQVRGHGAQPLYSFNVQLGRADHSAPEAAADSTEDSPAVELRIGLRQVRKSSVLRRCSHVSCCLVPDALQFLWRALASEVRFDLPAKGHSLSVLAQMPLSALKPVFAFYLLLAGLTLQIGKWRGSAGL